MNIPISLGDMVSGKRPTSAVVYMALAKKAGRRRKLVVSANAIRSWTGLKRRAVLDALLHLRDGRWIDLRVRKRQMVWLYFVRFRIKGKWPPIESGLFATERDWAFVYSRIRSNCLISSGENENAVSFLSRLREAGVRAPEVQTARDGTLLLQFREMPSARLALLGCDAWLERQSSHQEWFVLEREPFIRFYKGKASAAEFRDALKSDELKPSKGRSFASEKSRFVMLRVERPGRKDEVPAVVKPQSQEAPSEDSKLIPGDLPMPPFVFEAFRSARRIEPWLMHYNDGTPFLAWNIVEDRESENLSVVVRENAGMVRVEVLDGIGVLDSREFIAKEPNVGALAPLVETVKAYKFAKKSAKMPGAELECEL